jgi:hypothetical protein
MIGTSLILLLFDSGGQTEIYIYDADTRNRVISDLTLELR